MLQSTNLNDTNGKTWNTLSDRKLTLSSSSSGTQTTTRKTKQKCKTSPANHRSCIIKQLHACAKAGNPTQAEKHLQELISLCDQEGHTDKHPDFRHYNSLMHSWIKSNAEDKEYRAQSILEWMCNQQLTQTTTSINAHLKPSNVSFNICINAWSKSKNKNAANVAWYLFETMHTLAKQGHVSPGPDYHTYRSTLQALSNNVEMGTAQRAERLLKIMHDRHDAAVKPDDSIYHIVMHIYSHNKEMRAPEKVEELLADMHNRYQAGDQGLKPSTLTFNTLLNTYAKSSFQVDTAADRAENILHHMQDLYERGFGNVQPDIISFNTVINAHANSRGKQGADRRAYAILKKMRALHAAGRITDGPVTRTYNACLKACLCNENGPTGTSTATCNTKEENEASMALAYELMSYLHSSAVELCHEAAAPDEHTYNWFFKACAILCEDEERRQSMVQWACDLCRKNGLFTRKLQAQVKQIMEGHKDEYVQTSLTLPFQYNHAPSPLSLHSDVTASSIPAYTSWTADNSSIPALPSSPEIPQQIIGSSHLTSSPHNDHGTVSFIPSYTIRSSSPSCFTELPHQISGSPMNPDAACFSLDPAQSFRNRAESEKKRLHHNYNHNFNHNYNHKEERNIQSHQFSSVPLFTTHATDIALASPTTIVHASINTDTNSMWNFNTYSQSHSCDSRLSYDSSTMWLPSVVSLEGKNVW